MIMSMTDYSDWADPFPSGETRAEISDTAGPKEWRVMGLWQDGREFLLTLADSARDAVARLGETFQDWTHEELKDVDSVWVEHWIYEEVLGTWQWYPVAEIPLRRFRLRLAALEQHAQKRTA